MDLGRRRVPPKKHVGLTTHEASWSLLFVTPAGGTLGTTGGLGTLSISLGEWDGEVSVVGLADFDGDAVPEVLVDAYRYAAIDGGHDTVAAYTLRGGSIERTQTDAPIAGWLDVDGDGRSDDEANDVVQETFIGVANNLQKKKFYTSLGSFKSFLLNQARWRILDQFRRRKKQQSREANLYADETDERRTAPIDRCADPNGMALEKLWDKEWQDKVMDIALRRVRALVSPRQFQIFSCYVLKGWSPERVKKELGVNAAQVYLAKHRVGRILTREAARLSEEEQ